MGSPGGSCLQSTCRGVTGIRRHWKGGGRAKAFNCKSKTTAGWYTTVGNLSWWQRMQLCKMGKSVQESSNREKADLPPPVAVSITSFAWGGLLLWPLSRQVPLVKLAEYYPRKNRSNFPVGCWKTCAFNLKKLLEETGIPEAAQYYPPS